METLLDAQQMKLLDYSYSLLGVIDLGVKENKREKKGENKRENKKEKKRGKQRS